MDLIRQTLSFILLCLLSLEFSTGLSQSNNKYIPEFISLPPPVTYFQAHKTNSITLKCKVWPPTARVTFVIVKDNNRIIGTNNEPVEPFRTGVTSNGGEASVHLTNIDQIRAVAVYSLFCKARTDFGVRLSSRPFRIRQAFLDEFVANNPADRSKQFLAGNIALVECYLPRSIPPAQLLFKLNNKYLNVSDSRKYRLIQMNDESHFSLLIDKFRESDAGDYRCVAKNPILDVTVEDKVSTILKYHQSITKVEAKIKRNISDSKEISVQAGRNITLFCIIESAPPTPVTTYKYVGRERKMISSARHTTNADFGTLTIVNVTQEDEGLYVCSEGKILSSTVQLRVKNSRQDSLLQVNQAPAPIQVKGYGDPARFTCIFSDLSITPRWFLNGIATPSNRDGGSLFIPNVTRRNTGIYQCAANVGDEWVIRTTTLSKVGDFLITRPIPTNKWPTKTITPSANRDASIRLRCSGSGQSESQRVGHYIWYVDDIPLQLKKNIVFLYPNENDRSEISIDATALLNRREANILCEQRLDNRVLFGMTFYLNLRHLKPIENHREKRRDPNRVANRLVRGLQDPLSSQPALTINPTPDVMQVFDNLAVRLSWNYTDLKQVKYYNIQYRTYNNTAFNEYSTEQTINKKLNSRVFYIQKELKAGNIYEFRVVAYLTRSDNNPFNKDNTPYYTEWTKQISFEHIMAQGPIIESLRIKGGGKALLKWRYSEVPLDYFNVLYRPVKKSPHGILIPTKGYRSLQVKKQKREVLVKNLRYGVIYQFVIYAVSHYSNNLKRSSVFSQPVDIAMPDKLPVATNRNWFLFIILGSLVGAMLIVMLILVILCICKKRRRNDKYLTDANGLGYKDPALLAHRDAKRLLQSQQQSNFQMQQMTQGGMLLNNPQLTRHGSRQTVDSSNLMADHYSQQQLHQLHQYQQHEHQQSLYRQQGGGLVPMTTPGPNGFYGNGTLKREPPSGGSVHDNSDNEEPGNYPLGSVGPRNGSYIGGSSGMLHPGSPMGHPPANSQFSTLMARQLSHQQLARQYSHQSLAYPPGYAGSVTGSMMSPHPQNMNPYFTMSPYMQPPPGAHGQGGGYAPLPMIPPGMQPQPFMMSPNGRPSQLEVNGLQHQNSNDAESVYSYYSQQEPYMHQGSQSGGLNSLGNSNDGQSQSGFAEAGSQTVSNSTGQHKHRRRRRKAHHHQGTLEQVGETVITEEQKDAATGGAVVQDHQQQQHRAEDHPHHQHQQQDLNQEQIDYVAAQQNNEQSRPGYGYEDQAMNEANLESQYAHQKMLQQQILHQQMLQQQQQQQQQQQHYASRMMQPVPPIPGEEEPRQHAAFFNQQGMLDNRQNEMPQDNYPTDETNPYASRRQFHLQLQQQQQQQGRPLATMQLGGGAMHANRTRHEAANPNMPQRYAEHLAEQNTLTRRGTPTLFGEPPRVRDYSEYGIHGNQRALTATTSSAGSDTSTPPPPQRFGSYREAEA